MALLLPRSLCLQMLILACSRAQDMRDTLLKLARERIEVMYRDRSQFDAPQQSDDIVMRLSKEDFQCAPDGQKEGVPLTFMDFTMDGVRPVDAFNVLSNVMKQPSWDSSCSAAVNLGDFKQQRARGGALAFAAKPLSTREMYEWIVVDANLTSEEFWVVFSTLNGQALHERKPNMAGAVNAQNCLAAYRFRKTKGGLQATMTQQINGHSFPLTARYVATMAFGQLVSWVKAFRAQAKIQAGLNWNASRLFPPEWMLHAKNCTAEEADTDSKNNLMSKAVAELNRDDPGVEQTPPKLPDGRMWQRIAECGNQDVPSERLPMWQLEFRVKDVSPEELFNVLADKLREPSWNKQVVRAELLDQHSGGARGIHEALASPKAASSLLDLLSPRELWEWQVANHSIANQTYLLVLSSQGQSTSSLFDSKNVKAVQCLAAYEVSPAAAGGSFLRVISQPNPNVALAGKLSFLWRILSKRMLGEWAAQLTAEAQRLSKERKDRHVFPVDGGVLALLAPAPPTRNASMCLQNVLDSGDHWLDAFAQLDIPAQLNSTGDSAKVAAAIHQLGLRLRANASQEELVVLHVEASDSLALQLQGEALAAIQWRILQQKAELECAPSGWKPDINNNTAAVGLSQTQLICIGLAVLLVVIGLVVACCCGCRKCRKQRQVRLADANGLLPQQVSTSSAVNPAASQIEQEQIA